MKKILVIGSAVHDLFIEHERPHLMEFEVDGAEVNYLMFEEGRKTEIKSLHHSTGGGALNSACCFTRLSNESRPCCKVGNDFHGAFIVEHLKAHGISSDLIAYSDSVETGSSYILPSPTGNSCVLVDRGANLTLSKEDIPFADFGSYDQIYVTSLSKNTSELLPLISAEARKTGTPLSVNPGTSQLTANVQTLIDSLSNINILILNTVESTLLAENFFGKNGTQAAQEYDEYMPELLATPIAREKVIFKLQEYFKAVHDHGTPIAIVTNGEDGVYVSDGSHIFYHPSLPIEVESTVGAGDAFGATFTSQMLLGKSIENAIRAGIINSAAVLEHLDATSGLLDQEELDELVAELDQNGIKKYSCNN